MNIGLAEVLQFPSSRSVFAKGLYAFSEVYILVVIESTSIDSRPHYCFDAFSAVHTKTFDAERAMILLALIKMINLITAVKEEQNMFFLKLLTLVREPSICTRVAILKVSIGRSRVGDQRASMSW